MAIESKKKIIFITIITSILLVVLIVLLIVLLAKKPATEQLPNAPVIITTDETLDGEFILEEEKADPTSVSIATAEIPVTETPTTETASVLPKTGAATDFFAFAIFAGALTTYLASLHFKNNLAI